MLTQIYRKEIVADVYLRRLGKFCKIHQMTPITLMDLVIDIDDMLKTIKTLAN